MEASVERRKFPRFNLLVDVLVSKRAASERERLLVTKNISQGGVCIIAYEEFQEQDILDLRIFLPEDNVPLQVTGKVAWIKEFVIGDSPGNRRYDMGVEFMDIDEESIQKINRHLFSFKQINL